MTELARGRLLRYGIAVDLALMATGAGMLVTSPELRVVLYAVAVGVAFWKGQWSGGLAAYGLSAAALVVVFSGETRAGHLIALSSATILLLITNAATRKASGTPASSPAEQGASSLPAPPEVQPSQEEAAPAADMQRQFDQLLAAESAAAPMPPKRPWPSPAVRRHRRASARLASLIHIVASWFAPRRERKQINLLTARVACNQLTRPPAVRRNTASAAPRVRLLMVERRRATADTAMPRLRLRGLDVAIVERWIDAADELFRLRPDVLLLDVEHPEFSLILRTIKEKNPSLPIIFTGSRGTTVPASLEGAHYVTRPYEADSLARLTRDTAATERETSVV